MSEQNNSKNAVSLLPEDRQLEQAVGELLRKHSLTIATAESCTGGLLSHKLTLVPGSSGYFPLGLVTYDNRWKVNLLNIPEETITTNGAVSPEVAEAMARGVRQRAGTDLGIGITGIAGPGGGTAEKPVGLVYIGLADDKRVTVKRYHFTGDRAANKENTARAALQLLYDYLVNLK